MMVDVGTAVGRPWGLYRVLARGPGFQVKLLLVHPYCRLSLQSHENREEIWTVVDGSGLFRVGYDETEGTNGDVFLVLKGMKHRIRNTGSGLLKIVEVQLGDPDEDDIVRYEDDYGRA